jgi:hypothetical protein
VSAAGSWRVRGRRLKYELAKFSVNIYIIAHPFKFEVQRRPIMYTSSIFFVPTSFSLSREGIFKLSRSPGIDSKEQIPPVM